MYTATQCGTLSRSVAWATAFLPWRTKCFLRCSLDNRCHTAPGFGFFTATLHAKTLRCSRSCCNNLKTRRAQVSTKPRLRTPAALLLHAVQHISCHAAVPCCTPQPIVRQPQVHRCKASAPCAALLDTLDVTACPLQCLTLFLLPKLSRGRPDTGSQMVARARISCPPPPLARTPDRPSQPPSWSIIASMTSPSSKSAPAGVCSGRRR